MSRIEKALEKAVEMRKSAKDTTIETVIPEEPIRFGGFKNVHRIIDANAVDKRIVCIVSVHSSAAEQYKRLRARLIRETAPTLQNNIVITSPDVGEGKSITAINLAAALANEMDYTVLLIDADLKRPSVHKYLGIENRYGLSDCLMGHRSFADVLIKTGLGNLALLTAGSAVENPSELLSSEAMRRLVQEMKHRYRDRYIIIDSPPILMTAEALSLASYADGVLLVIEAGRTTPEKALNAISHIKGSNVLGVVLNNMPKYLSKHLYPDYYYGKKKIPSSAAEREK